MWYYMNGLMLNPYGVNMETELCSLPLVMQKVVFEFEELRIVTLSEEVRVRNTGRYKNRIVLVIIIKLKKIICSPQMI